MRIKAIAYLILMMLACIGLQGCFNIPPIPVTITLANNQALPAVLGTIAGTNISGTASLPDVCSLPTETELQELAAAYVPSFLFSLFEIDSITLDKVDVVANAGDFDDFTSVGLSMVVDSDPISLGQTNSATGLGTEFVIEPIPPVDMYHTLLDRPSGSCITPQLTVVGKVPSEPLTYTITADITFTVKFR